MGLLPNDLYGSPARAASRGFFHSPSPVSRLCELPRSRRGGRPKVGLGARKFPIRGLYFMLIETVRINVWALRLTTTLLVGLMKTSPPPLQNKTPRQFENWRGGNDCVR